MRFKYADQPPPHGHSRQDEQPTIQLPPEPAAGASSRGRSIGELIGELKQLSEAQIQRVLMTQGKRGVRFGEAAVDLGLASRDDVLWAISQQFDYPYAGDAPKARYKALVAARNPFGTQAEAFRELRSQLMMGALSPDEGRRALAVVSPDAGDGRSFVAANLAVAFSQLGARTLLLDLDLRAPTQHELFGLDNRSGLSAILAGRTGADTVRQVEGLPSLFVMPVGSVPPNPLELVQRPAFSQLIREVLAKFDHVIVDTPAASRGADARVVAAQCGAVLAIGRQGRSRVQAMQRLVAQLGQGGARLAGVVVNER